MTTKTAKPRKTAKAATKAPGKPERYFRVYTSEGQVIHDVLQERLAKRCRNHWNRDAERLRLPKCHLVRLKITEEK